VTGADCFHVQGDCGGNGTYFSNRRNETAVQNVNEEGREVTRYGSNQIKPKTLDQDF
jgi:hypothetical protein